MSVLRRSGEIHRRGLVACKGTMSVLRNDDESLGQGSCHKDVESEGAGMIEIVYHDKRIKVDRIIGLEWNDLVKLRMIVEDLEAAIMKEMDRRLAKNYITEVHRD